MGLWGSLLKIGGAVAAPFTGGASLALTGLGAGLGAASQGMANNRGEKFAGQMDLERLMLEREQQLQNQQIDREQEGRAGASDAWRKLLSTQHTLAPGARPQLSPYSIAPRQPNEAEQVGANYLGGQSLARLQNGNPIPQVTQHPLQVDPKLLNAGWLERLLGIGGAGLGVYGALAARKGGGGGGGDNINV